MPHKRRTCKSTSRRLCEQAVEEHMAWLMELDDVVGVGVYEGRSGYAIALYVSAARKTKRKLKHQIPSVVHLKHTGIAVPVKCIPTVGSPKLCIAL